MSISNIKRMMVDFQQAATLCREWATEIAPVEPREDRPRYGERPAMRRRRADLLRQLAKTFDQEAQLTRESLVLIEV